MQKAKRDNGSFLIPEQYRNADDCGKLSDALTTMFKRQNFNYDGFRNDSLIAHNCGDDIFRISGDAGPRFGEFRGLPRDIVVEIAIGSDGMDYRAYRTDGSAVSLQDIDNGLWDRIKNFACSVAKKAVETTKIAVQWIGEKVVATIDFVLDALPRVLHFVLDTLRDVFDAVLSLFASIEVDFQKLFEWLGQLFRWSDIANTQKYLLSLMDESCTWLQEKTQWIKEATAKTMDGMEKNAAIMSRASSILPSTLDTEKEAAKLDNSHPINVGRTHNIVFNRLADMQDSATTAIVIDDDEAADLGNLLDEIRAVLSNFGSDKAEIIREHQQVFVDGCKSSRPAVMAEGLANITGQIASLMKEKVKSVVNGLMDLCTRILAKVKEIWHREVFIPLLSSLFSKVFGMSLTFGNIGSLVIAIPVTIVCKLMTGAPPVLVDENSGFGNKKSLLITSAVCVAIYYTVSAINVFAPDPSNLICFIVRTFVPFSALCAWFMADLIELKKVGTLEDDAEWSSVVGTVISALFLVMEFLGLFVGIIKVVCSHRILVASAQAVNDLFNTIINVLSSVLGCCSIIAGIVELALMEQCEGKKKKTVIEVMSHRGSLLPGIADTCFAVGSLIAPDLGGYDRRDDECDAADPRFVGAFVLMVAGALGALAEAVFLFIEAFQDESDDKAAGFQTVV